jgi:hypothetical protein
MALAPSFGLVGGAVELDHLGVDFLLVAGVEALDRGGDALR